MPIEEHAIAHLPAPLQASIAKSDLSLKNIDKSNSYSLPGFCLRYKIPVAFSFTNGTWAAGLTFKRFVLVLVLVTTKCSTHDVIDNCSKNRNRT